MSMAGATVGVDLPQVDTGDIELPVSHAAFGDQRVGERPDDLGGSLEDDGLKVLIVIQMRVHSRHREFVVRVLDLGEALRQRALVMVVDVREVRDTVPLRAVPLVTELHLRSQDVAERLAA